jgi:hypothetical protein
MRVLVSACFLLCGCFHIRLNEKTGDAQKQEHVLTTPFTDTVIDHPCAQYGNTGLETVRYKSNLGYAWLSVITLGIVNYVDVEYSCEPQDGVEPAKPPTP